MLSPNMVLTIARIQFLTSKAGNFGVIVIFVYFDNKSITVREKLWRIKILHNFS